MRVLLQYYSYDARDDVQDCVSFHALPRRNDYVEHDGHEYKVMEVVHRSGTKEGVPLPIIKLTRSSNV